MTRKKTPEKSASAFKEKFQKEIIPLLRKELNLKNPMAVPRITKVKVNVGIGSYLQKSGTKDFAPVVENIAALTGQKPIVIRSKKAISNFKLKIGMPIGVIATLRGKRMYDFLNKLINLILPRIRDFRGISVSGFDGKGNYNLGIREVTVFPEVNPDAVIRDHGLQISIVTTAGDNRKGYFLLKALGFPFRDNIEKKGPPNL